jgi:hypothetical protein
MANSFDGNNVKVGPGTLYAAPLGTPEPAGNTVAWPSAWQQLGYTDNGSEFDMNPTTAAVEVEEEYWPIRNVTTAIAATMTFALAEQTARNLALSLNVGIGSGVNGTNLQATGNGAGGAATDIWVEPPNIGAEVRVMLGWDSLSPTGAGTAASFGRLICRQTYQSGTMKITRQKGNNKATYACEFSLEKPTGLQPFRFWFPAALGGGIVLGTGT